MRKKISIVLAGVLLAGCAQASQPERQAATSPAAGASAAASPGADWRKPLAGVSIPIVGYHHIAADAKARDIYSVRTADFAAHMRYLRDNHFHPISIGELADFLQQGKPLPDKPILVTFDDGYQSTLTVAAPIMKQTGINKSVLFVYTSFVDSGLKGTIRWAELQQLEKHYGFDIQCHTFTHPLSTAHDFGKGFKYNPQRDGVEPDAAYVKRIYETQLVYPKRRMEQQLHHPITHLAWPFGLYNQQVTDLAKKAGFQYLYTINPSSNDVYTSPYGLRRTLITYGIGAAGFAAIVNARSLAATSQTPADGEMLRQGPARFTLKLAQPSQVDTASLRAQVDGDTVPVKWNQAAGTVTFLPRRPIVKHDRFHEVQVWGTDKGGRNLYKIGWAFYMT